MIVPMDTLLKSLSTFLPDHDIITDPALCFAYGTDASMYRLIPKVVLFVTELNQIKHILHHAHLANRSVTFRAAGTSLSGQAISDDILVVLKNGYWREFSYDTSSHVVSVGVGMIGAEVNRKLQPFGRKIGPDPASIDSCKIGGIAANNASGMCCGVEGNTYHTMHSMVFMLANGTCVDTADSQSRRKFEQQNQVLLAQLSHYAQSVRENPELLRKILHKYRIKNTSGYALNALVDFDDPIDMLAHLLVGSEGTLGFIALVRYHTQALQPYKADWLLQFANTTDFCEALAQLQSCPITTAELMDAKALTAGLNHYKGKHLQIDNITTTALALLIETEAEHPQQLDTNITQIANVISNTKSKVIVNQTQDLKEIAQLWRLRKGALPTVGGNRPLGSTVVIEDVCVETEKLGDLIEGLRQRLNAFSYSEGAILGHALAGNLHFVFTPRFDQPASQQCYRDFMDSVCAFVAEDLGGSLKGEHGTGRNMAPYLALEWGQTAYQLMCDLKTLIDPHTRLNPDVIISRHSDIHVKHLKHIPATHSLIDHCMECGFCEAVCPTRQYDVTPRQRIALLRYQQLTQQPLSQVKPFMQSCVGTQLCMQRCPVGIDTSKVAQHLSPPRDLWIGKALVQFPSAFKALLALGQWGKNWGSLTFEHLPKPAPRVTAVNENAPDAIYLPSCVSKIMGNDPQQKNGADIITAMQNLAKKAGLKLQVITAKQCCGQAQKQAPNDALLKQLKAYSDNGLIPIITDMSSCAHHFHQHQLTIIDSVEWIYRQILPRVKVPQKLKKVALHITCSSQHLGHEQMVQDCAKAIAEDVIIPENIACCGFAGSRGFTDPQINASALHTLHHQVSECEVGISTNRTCQIGLSRHSGLVYQHIAQVFDQIVVNAHKY